MGARGQAAGHKRMEGAEGQDHRQRGMLPSPRALQNKEFQKRESLRADPPKSRWCFREHKAEHSQAPFDTGAGAGSYLCCELVQSALFVMMFSGLQG